MTPEPDNYSLDELAGNELPDEFKGKSKKKKKVTNSITLRCVPCTQTFTISKKNNKGELEEQQVCPHTIYVDSKVK